MSDRTVTDYANEAVKQLAIIAPHFELLKNVTFEVQVEDDSLAVINFEGEDLFIEVHLSEQVAGIGRTYLRPTYVPGYYKHHGGGYWHPPEVEDIQLDECHSVSRAVTDLMGIYVQQQIEDILEAEAYRADAGDIFEEIA